MLWAVCLYSRGELRIARELGEQRLTLAQRPSDPALLLEATWRWGTFVFLGEFGPCPELRGAGGCPPRSLSSTALMPFQYGFEPGVLPLLMAGDLWGCWAIQTRPCRGARRR